MGRDGRRSKAYLTAAREYRTGNHPCHFGCGQPGTTVDHQPPLSTAPTPDQWQGVLLPACRRCQSRQGGLIRQAKRRRAVKRWSY